MSNDGTRTAVAAVVIAVIVAVQGYLLYRVVQLDAAERYSEIPLLLGTTLMLYAVILYLYLRVYIGVKAYKKLPSRPEGETE